MPTIKEAQNVNPRYVQLDDTARSLYREISRLRNFVREPGILPEPPENLSMDIYALTRVVRSWNDTTADHISKRLSSRNRKEK